jgi:cation transport regulator ChaC
MADYVFGYGSLLERASRTSTNSDAVGAWPARVEGFERGWFHQFENFVGSTCTFLGAKKAPGETINGVIYAVEDLQKTKDREIGYTATLLDVNQITMLDGGGQWKSKEKSDVYIFLSNPPCIKPPSAETPMVQSYVDICINGCLELEALYRTLNEPLVKESFTKEFIRTSREWSEFWVNDRIYPRRPGAYRPSAKDIDKALQAGGVLHYRQPPDRLVVGKGQFHS